MSYTPLPHIPRAREEDHLRTFLLERLQPRAGVPKALFLSGPSGAGKKTLVRRVFESDPRFRAYQVDAASREILFGTGRPGAWKEPAVDAVGSLLGAANPAAGVAAGVLSPFVKGLFSSRSAPSAPHDSFLEETEKPLLVVVPRIDAEDGGALSFFAHCIREAYDRALPHALVILDDSPLPDRSDAYPNVPLTLAGLRRFLGDDRRLDVLTLSAFSEAECQEVFSRMGLSADWAVLLYQLSDGGVAELCSLWRSLQTAGVLVPTGKGRWKTVQPAIASTKWTIVRDAFAALLQHRIPKNTPHRNRLLDACHLAAAMGSTFLPQAVAECIFEVDPKRDELDCAEWEDLWYDVLEYEHSEHPALAAPCFFEESPKVLQGDERQFFVHAFRDPGLRNLLRAATRQMWREWEAHEEPERPHELLVAGSRALEAWIGRAFEETWPRALAFRSSLLEVSNRTWEAGRLETLDHRLRLLEKLGNQIEEERQRVTNGKEAVDLFAFLLWFGETLCGLGNHAQEADALSEAKALADRGNISLSVVKRVDLQSKLGVSLSNCGAYREAEMLLEETLNLSIGYLGTEHPRTLTSLNNLAALYEMQGRYDEAEPLYLRALEGRARVLGPEHPHTFHSLNNLATVYVNQRRDDEAEPLFLRALEGLERTLTADHPTTLSSVNNLAGLYASQDRYGIAEPLYLRALKGRERVFGPDHPETLESLTDLAGLYKSQGRHDEAEPLYLRAFEGRARVLGPDHPETLTSLITLVALYGTKGHHDEVEPLFLQSLERLERVVGPEHRYALSSVNDLANLYESQGRHDEAEPLYLRALEGRERLLGPDDPETLTSVSNLASLYAGQGRYQEAEPLYLRGVEGLERALGPEHPDTLTLLNNLASLYHRQGRHDEADMLYLRALEGLERVLGPEHPRTLATINNLAALYEMQGRRDAAARMALRKVVFPE